MESFSTLIDEWPSVDALAQDTRTNPATVRKWKQRNSIPSDRWMLLLAGAKKRKIHVNESALIRMASREVA